MADSNGREANAKQVRLFVIGGGEDPDEEHMRILPRFVELCGGSAARLIVFGVPAEKPEEKERTYRDLFERIGVASVRESSVTDRLEGNTAEELLRALDDATGVFLTGGDQLRLTSQFAGTRVEERLRARYEAGELIIGGTSAGAAGMSGTMVIGGNSGGTVRRRDVELAPGLGFWPDVIVDTHFSERGRVSRILTIFAQNPGTLGIGIDSDTAVEVVPEKEMWVTGSGAVYVFDGRVTHTDATDKRGDEVIALTDSLLHVLPDGYGFDLATERPILPDGARIEGRQS